MQRTKAILLIPGTALLLAALLLNLGCTDAVTDTEARQAASETVVSKMRQAHLFGDGTGKVLERYAELMTYTDFVIGVSPTVLDMQRVLDRYTLEAGVKITQTYKKVYKGFAMQIEAAQVDRMLHVIERDPDIAWMEPDAKMTFSQPRASNFKSGNHQHLPWGVDRIDADLSSTRAGDETGRVRDVEIYILDSGIKEHDANVVEKRSFVPGYSDSGDRLGHGTHVAGTAAAQDNSFGVVGVAPGANVHSLKVLNNGGQTELSTVITAVEYITEHKQNNPSTPIVVNISLGADVGTTRYNALDEAIASSIAQGVLYVIAAGNEGVDVSTVTPAHVAEAITVGAYDEEDRFASFSNFGALVDLLAPGVDVVSSTNATGAKKPPVMMSGTSTAAPHVTGAAALYLSRHPRATPEQVREALVRAARASVSGAPSGTTNKSVYVGGF